MQKRCIGKSDIEVSVIGLGTVKFGRTEGVHYPVPFTLPSDSEIDLLLHSAKDLGINLIDTAPAYGLSEERLGKLLGNRSDWIISTKVGETFSEGISTFHFSHDAIKQSIENSLRKLRTDYLDIVFVHSSGDDLNIIQNENVFSILEELKQQGKIRLFGMSTKTIAGGLLTLDLADVAMVTFNPHYQDERDVLLHAREKNKGIFIKKALASGHLAKGKKAIQESMKCLTMPGVTSVIVGTINPDHLRENVESAESVLTRYL